MECDMGSLRDFLMNTFSLCNRFSKSLTFSTDFFPWFQGRTLTTFKLFSFPFVCNQYNAPLHPKLTKPYEIFSNFSLTKGIPIVMAILTLLWNSVQVLFIHKFSGRTNVGSLLLISILYSSAAGLLLFTQAKSTGLAAPSLDVKWLGLAIFSVGLTGNGYHHWLLSQLRKDGSKGYVVPQGGLFGLLVCPHYVFEIIMFVGIAFMSQTWVGCATATLVFCYLTARTIKTKQWYMKKVDEFPEERSVLIPGVF